ncbi:alpha/beta fold hydrolase [uncultured Dokdonia sp.]|uniref:alpha/beta hydrolase family protein n=1 Tax=uncultured Dokdonia sp. TaxID=575653 RepID=UPI0030EB5E58|tara:strand:+ start:69170 stop:70537 length:1368 start_codon:yes stop_codon:yes gene_type:complete
MKALFTLTLGFLIALTSYSQEITGDWTGTVDFQGKKLDFAFHIQEENSALATTMDIPSQGLMAGKAATTTFTNDTLVATFPDFNIIYKGAFENDRFTGNIIQNNFPVALNLERGVITLNRPQQPKAPFNYTTKELVFKNKEDDIELSGTLTLPNYIKNPPVAIIISGSGPQNRDGDMFGHQLYYVLADYLTRQGIAVFRYDERGVGESSGTFKTAGIPESTRDATAALEYLKKRSYLKESKFGFIGHSIGGIIAPQIAATNDDVDFTVMLAGPGIDGDQLMLSQKAALERLLNVPEAQIKQGLEIIGRAYEIIVNAPENHRDLKNEVNAALLNKLGPNVPAQQVESITNQITTPEIISLLRTKPSTYLSKVKTPILAMNGKKDLQVPYEENLEAIKEAFAASNNERTRTVAFEGLNHLFQESTTGALTEYSEIEQTMAPRALALIAKWIKEETIR